MHIGSAWRDLDPSPNKDIIVLFLGDRPLVLGPDGVGVNDGVEWKSVGGAVPLPLGTVHPEVETGYRANPRTRDYTTGLSPAIPSPAAS